jgi:hypothetical protein
MRPHGDHLAEDLSAFLSEHQWEDAGADFCVHCANPAPWGSREKRLAWIKGRLNQPRRRPSRCARSSFLAPTRASGSKSEALQLPTADVDLARGLLTVQAA